MSERRRAPGPTAIKEPPTAQSAREAGEGAARQRPNPSGAIAKPLKDDGWALTSWTAAIVATLFVYVLSRNTAYHQMAIGALSAVVCLFVALTLVEIVWLLAAHATERRRDRRPAH